MHGDRCVVVLWVSSHSLFIRAFAHDLVNYLSNYSYNLCEFNSCLLLCNDAAAALVVHSIAVLLDKKKEIILTIYKKISQKLKAGKPP